MIQNRIIVLNGNKAPTNDLQLRKAIIHAVDKSAIIEQSLAGFAAAEDSLFPRNAPYCDVNLTPRADYDMEKALQLNCADAYDAQGCAQKDLKFIVMAGDAELVALEEGIRSYLALIGISVETQFLEKDAFNEAMQSGDFNLYVAASLICTVNLGSVQLCVCSGHQRIDSDVCAQVLLGDMGASV